MADVANRTGTLGSEGIQVGSIVYSGGYDWPATREIFGLNANVTTAQSADFSWPSGKTWTKDAVQRCRDMITAGPGARSGPDVSKVGQGHGWG